MRIACFLFGLLWLAPPAFAEPCVYAGADGSLRQAESIDRVPYAQRSAARCGNLASPEMAKPGEVSLSGLLREEDMASPIGRIKLRWARSIESLFGRNPLRATQDAAQAVSRALKQNSFPPAVRSLDLDWNVVFMTSDMKASQIPLQLITAPHPGWMVPPSDVYIVADRIKAGFAGTSSGGQPGDADMAKVLMHEFGHAVEFAMLGTAARSMDRMRSEGFAAWFEVLAARYSSVADSGILESQQKHLALATLSQQSSGWQFQGSSEDYAVAAMFFKALEKRRGVSGVADLYTEMKDNGTAFIPALLKITGWSQVQLSKELSAAASS